MSKRKRTHKGARVTHELINAVKEDIRAEAPLLEAVAPGEGKASLAELDALEAKWEREHRKIEERTGQKRTVGVQPRFADLGVVIKRVQHRKRACDVCRHSEKAQIRKEYMQWQTVVSISERFDIPARIITLHANSLGWAQERADNMHHLYTRLLTDIGETLDVSKLQSKDAVEALIKIARHIDRVQGKIVSRHQVDENRSITFTAIPLPGGAPALTEDAQLALPAPVKSMFDPAFPLEGEKGVASSMPIEAQFVETDEEEVNGDDRT